MVCRAGSPGAVRRECSRRADGKGVRRGSLPDPEALRGVVGWVASEVPSFRAILLKDHPEVALFEGDPEDSPIQKSRKGSGRSAETGRHIAVSMVGPAERLSKSWPGPQWSPSIAKLLHEYDSVDRVQERLLSFVRAGRYTSCVRQALRLAEAAGRDGRLRGAAIRAVGAAGMTTDQARLVNLIGEPDESVRAALLRTLVPDILGGLRLPLSSRMAVAWRSTSRLRGPLHVSLLMTSTLRFYSWARNSLLG